MVGGWTLSGVSNVFFGEVNKNTIVWPDGKARDLRDFTAIPIERRLAEEKAIK